MPSNGTGGGWTSNNVDGNRGYRSGYFILNSNGGSTDPTISQTLSSLLPGVTYTVSGWVVNVYSQYGDSNRPSFAASVTGNVINPGVKLTELKSIGTSSWTPFSLSFTANGTSATIPFAGETNGEDASYAVADISVVALNTKSFVADFGPGSVDLYIDLAGRQTSDNTGKPALFPVYATQLSRSSGRPTCPGRLRRQRHADDRRDRRRRAAT